MKMHEITFLDDLYEDAPCWKKYKQVGMKMKGGRPVPRCVLKSKKVKEDNVEEDWQKANKKDRTDGMSAAAVKTYRKEHPGSKLKTAVTKDPKKIKKGSSDDKRRKSFCARSDGQRKMHDIDCSATPDKAICKARRRWNC